MLRKDYAAVTISVLTLVIASAVAYGTLNVNSLIQAKTEPVTTPDYSAELGSLKSKVESINNNLSTLDNLKKDVTEIDEKLTDMQNKNNQVLQVTSSTDKLEILLDKSSYFSLDTIHITAIGAKPLNVVQVRLLDNDGFTVIYKQTWADSTGVVMYDLPLSNTLLSGIYQIKLVSGQQTDSQSVRIISSNQNTATQRAGSPYLFSAQTDKIFYQTEDLIQVLGTGTPNTSVTTVLTSPTGRTYTSNTTVQPDGTYSSVYSTQLFETGNWHATVTNLGQSKIVYFTIGRSSSVLTAHTDRTIYLAGDLVQVSGTGASPNTVVNVVLTSPSGNTYSTGTTANFDGTYAMSYSTSRSFETGTWYATVTNQGQSKVVYFSMNSSSGFTVHTDKMVYQKRDRIHVSGTGASPNTTVSGVLTSPSGNTYSTSTAANFDGTYAMSFTTSRSYETGTWYIYVTNNSQSRVVSIYLEPS